jgi:magnesium chelatase family protein
VAARSTQINRGVLNAKTPDNHLEENCKIDQTSKALLIAAMKRYHLSMRGFTRVIKVARTIADLERCPDIRAEHIAEPFSSGLKWDRARRERQRNFF